MTNTIEWIVEQLDCYPQHEGERDVVFTVHWRCNGSDGQYIGTAYGTQAITNDPKAPFTQYASLTQSQVIGWVKSAMGAEAVADVEAVVAAQIENQKKPPVVSPALPWG